MQKAWWTYLGKIAGAMFLIALVTMNHHYYAAAITFAILGIIMTATYFYMQQKNRL
jgi:hypothetical protein